MQAMLPQPRVLPSPRRPALPVVSCLPLVGRRQTLHCCRKTALNKKTLTHARSTILARRAKSPVRGQAKAWSPKTSTSPPHPGEGPHRFRRRGSGRRTRRRNACWWPGRPGWRLTRHPRAAQLQRQALGDMSGSNVRSRKCKLRVRDALCCQPCGQSPRLLSAATGGRAPSTIARQDGHSCQPSA